MKKRDEALAKFIEVVKNLSPKEFEATYVKDTKQITLRLPVSLYKKLRLEAERRGYSVNELILFLIQSDEYIVVRHTQSLY